jgi:tetratricopeptide (TPR) repeat protein
MAQMQIFLSHSSEDNDIAERMVTALLGAGADVWYHEQELGAMQLNAVQRQLRTRPVFLVLLSASAFASDWVRRECESAFNIQQRGPSHIILPVVIAPIDPGSFDAMPFLKDFKRVEGPHHTPYPEVEILERTLRLLALTPAGQEPAPITPQSADLLDDLMIQGRALAAQQRWADALLFFQRVTDLDPGHADAWAEQGRVLHELDRDAEALTAYDRALALNDQRASFWTGKGLVLDEQDKCEEALAVYDQALALDPNDVYAWNNKGRFLDSMRRSEEALAAYERALALDPHLAEIWIGTGLVLSDLGRSVEALAAYDRALEVDSTNATAWNNKAAMLAEAGRIEEAVEAFEHMLEWSPDVGFYCRARPMVAEALGCAVKRRAKRLSEAPRTEEMDSPQALFLTSRGNPLGRVP